MPTRIKPRRKPGAGHIAGPFKNHIRAWRLHRDLSQDDLVEKVRERVETFSKSTLSRLERGVPEGGGYRQPVLEALAAALDCRPSDLIEWDPTDARARVGMALRDIDDADMPRVEQIIGAFRGNGRNGS